MFNNRDSQWAEAFFQAEDMSRIGSEFLGWKEDSFEELCTKADNQLWMQEAPIEELLAF